MVEREKLDLEVNSNELFWFIFGSVKLMVIAKLSGNLSINRLSISNSFFVITIENLKFNLIRIRGFWKKKKKREGKRKKEKKK